MTSFLSTKRNRAKFWRFLFDISGADFARSLVFIAPWYIVIKILKQPQTFLWTHSLQICVLRLQCEFSGTKSYDFQKYEHTVCFVCFLHHLNQAIFCDSVVHFMQCWVEFECYITITSSQVRYYCQCVLYAFWKTARVWCMTNSDFTSFQWKLK